MKEVTHLILEEVQKKLGDIKSIAENHWDKQRIEKVIHNFVLNRFDIFLRDKIQTEFNSKVDEIIHNLIEQFGTFCNPYAQCSVMLKMIFVDFFIFCFY